MQKKEIESVKTRLTSKSLNKIDTLKVQKQILPAEQSSVSSRVRESLIELH